VLSLDETSRMLHTAECPYSFESETTTLLFKEGSERDHRRISREGLTKEWDFEEGRSTSPWAISRG